MSADKIQPTLVFVHLGRMKDFVLHDIEHAAAHSIEFETVLVTDRRVKVSKQIRVIMLSELVSKQEINDLEDVLSKTNFKPNFRNGYWTKVFLRFLVLRNLAKIYAGNQPFLHMECDVQSYLTAHAIEITLGSLDDGALSCWIPMIDPNTACPAVIIASNVKALSSQAGKVISEIGIDPALSDMGILACSTQEGSLGQLPTFPKKSQIRLRYMEIGGQGNADNSSKYKEGMLVFDAAVVGQYLFGIDPRNNSGVLVQGYREIRGDLDPSAWNNWRIVICEDQVQRLAFDDQGITGILGSLHVHAKICVPDLEVTSAFWIRTIAMANGLQGPRAQVITRIYVRHVFEEATRHLRRQLRKLSNALRKR